MKQFFILLVLLGAGWLGSRLLSVGVERQAVHQVCELVREKFFRDDEDLAIWYRDCLVLADEVSWFWSREELLWAIQQHLNSLGASHLVIYTPSEDRRLWVGQALDTGIRTWHIGEHWVVARVIEGSSAAKMGVLPGDKLVSINGDSDLSVRGIEESRGHFLLLRGKEKLDILIEPTELSIDSAPFVSEVSPGVARLEISTFRAEHFTKEKWLSVVEKLAPWRKVIVDLRGNQGGNLVAMLRTLSTFLCSSPPTGQLTMPRRLEPHPETLADNLVDRDQLQQITRAGVVNLQTFSDYGCYRGQVVVLVDRQTGSVAEIFADALRDKAQVKGEPTAGDVLMATWYSLRVLGAGYTLSIPEINYVNNAGEALEGHGVWPKHSLEYLLEDALNGRDSWLK